METSICFLSLPVWQRWTCFDHSWYGSRAHPVDHLSLSFLMVVLPPNTMIIIHKLRIPTNQPVHWNDSFSGQFYGAMIHHGFSLLKSPRPRPHGQLPCAFGSLAEEQRIASGHGPRSQASSLDRGSEGPEGVMDVG